MNIHSILQRVVPERLVCYRRGILWIQKKTGARGKLDIISKANIVLPKMSLSLTDDYVRQAGKVLRNVGVSLDGYYIYPYDKWVIRVLRSGVDEIVSNTPDYAIILKSDLSTLYKELSGKKSSFARSELLLIRHIDSFADKIFGMLSEKDEERAKQLAAYFKNLTNKCPESLDEAIQKLLFYNALFWQMGHWHCGLGRLDLILDEYYEHDLKRGILTRERAKELIRKLCITLGKDTVAKSQTLKGDTGQYILLGGIDKNGQNVHNDLTELFLEVFSEMKIPDPKLILRVNDETPDVIWTKAVECILTGCGSPLLMNETRIMSNMVDFGYDKEDVYNVGTSACWEPLIIGKSFDQNNPLPNIPAILSVNKTLRQSAYTDFPTFYEAFRKNLEIQIRNGVKDVAFDSSPLYSLFFDDCIKKEKDYTEGGAVYSYHGVQIVSFPNLINALLNIQDYVFTHHYFTQEQCVEALDADFEGYGDMQTVLKSNERKFGSNDESIIALTNDLMQFISDVVSECRINGERVKVGFSSSQYIFGSKTIEATMDGRRKGEPFAVHISPVSQKIDLQEILDFACALDYGGNRINGNVVDFICPTAIAKNPEKLVAIMKRAMHNGVFEMQLNVLDAETLKDAKKHPEKYPTLVVRVWGFSAYFNDLPEEYKNNLIRRAEMSA